MAWAASMRPLSIWAKAVSICRAKKGTVPKIKGRMAPLVPMAVPTTARVRGMRAPMRMMKGMERNRLITRSNVVYTSLFSRMLPGLVTVSTTPSTMPMTKEIAPEKAIKYKVC